MAASEWLSDGLLASLKRRGLIPTALEPFGEADFLALANEELRTYVLPLVRKVREELLWTRSSLALVAGQKAYRLPARCAAEVLRTAHLDDGTEEPPMLQRIEPQQASALAAAGASGPAAYYLEDDSLVLVPKPAGAGTLLLRHLFRPGQLVAGASAAEVTAFNAGAKTVTFRLATQVAGVPSGFATGLAYDIIRGVPGFRCRAMDATATLASNVLTFSASLPADIAAGDFLALAGQSPVPQVPSEFHPLLAERIAYVCARALSAERGEEMRPELERMEARVESLFAQRTEGTPRYVHNFFAPGWGRGLPSKWRRP